MASITIREVDKTTPGTAGITTNAVYVPGLAMQGPAGVPTYCSSLQEFQRLFGTQPYTWLQDQSYPSEIFGAGVSEVYARKGEYERSYIYASELLRRGLPIVYDRLGTATAAAADVYLAYEAGDDSSERCKVSVTSVLSEERGNRVWCKLERGEFADGANTTQAYFTISAVEASSDAAVAPTEGWKEQLRFWANPEASVIPYIPFTSQTVLGEQGPLVAVTGVSFDSAADGEDTAKLSGGAYTVSLAGIYKTIVSRLSSLSVLRDRGEYAIKYLTTGAYPLVSGTNNTYAFTPDGSTATTTVAAALREACLLAGVRGDSTFLVDAAPLCETASSFHSACQEVVRGSGAVVPGTGEDAYTFAASFYFDASYSTADYGVVRLPGSFAYLKCLANSVQNNPNWFAIAGMSRGVVSEIARVHHAASSLDADEFQPRDGVAVNCVPYITPYGYVIWGTRTLKDNRRMGDLTALSFLSVRQMTNDIKRVTYLACKSLMFEQNSDVLWIAFKARVTPTLDNMKTSSGVRDYTITRLKSDRKGEVKARITLVPIEPVEDWDITVELTDSLTAVAG